MSFTSHPGVFESQTATIAATGTKTDAIEIAGCSLIGLVTPAALTSTSITFEVSNDGSTFYSLYDSNGSQVSLNVSTGVAYSMDPQWFAPWRYMKIVGDSSEAASRDFTVVGRAL